jgi:hypothetical protein
MLLANAAKCLKCGDEIFSAFTHDFKECECGDLFVDGGMSYVRHGFKNRDNYMDLSITIDDFTFDMMMSSLDWADDNGRNNLGRICAIVRAIRDSGYEITKGE